MERRIIKILISYDLTLSCKKNLSFTTILQTYIMFCLLGRLLSYISQHNRRHLYHSETEEATKTTTYNSSSTRKALNVVLEGKWNFSFKDAKILLFPLLLMKYVVQYFYLKRQTRQDYIF